MFSERSSRARIYHWTIRPQGLLSAALSWWKGPDFEFGGGTL
jgi:hypothetical protein